MSSSTNHEHLIRTLLRPEAYPWQPAEVELIETHISWLFLAGDRVIKVKRPVHFGFVDHSTPARRRHSCEEEVRLNRRLTDGIYLGIVPIVRLGDRLVVDAAGEPFEWATLMRRLPAERMLDQLLRSGSAPADLADRLADRLVPFHRTAAEWCDGETAGPGIVLSNLDEIGDLTRSTQLALVDGAMRSLLTERHALLQERLDGGWFKDGHGDLRAEHVCLDDDGTIQIFDCVEFNPEIRCADVASDLAFLLMDLDRLQASEIAVQLVERYRERGVDLADAILRFYRGHRALVRAKIALLTGDDALQTHPGMVTEAATYLDLATAAMLVAAPCVIAMTGLSGTGKSTVAASLARATGATLVSSDVTRKELAGLKELERGGNALYSADWNERTYRHLIATADTTIGQGKAVILDATFLEERWRELAAGVAKAAGVPFLLVETVCDEAIARDRIARRSAEGRAVSDADLTVYERQRRRVPPGSVAIPLGAIAVQVDTGADAITQMNPVYEALRRAGLLAPRN
ncbi:MAG: AAA family ATPase [Thermomicrobiales bacterium]|nr:AAA family ATPase [Thermomicrobiales bacterium]